jgi:hypothetical protein
MAYPDWLMRYKEKGIYFQKKDDDTYRVIRAHSERVPGKKHPRLVIDEYIGTATREGGLVPYMPTVKGEVSIKRYGMYFLVFERLKPSRLGAGLVQGYLLWAYGSPGHECWEADWASEREEYVEVSRLEAGRVARALESLLRSELGPRYERIVALAPFCYRLFVNGKWMDIFAQGWGEALGGSDGR